jgi:murein peptide amidase A
VAAVDHARCGSMPGGRKAFALFAIMVALAAASLACSPKASAARGPALLAAATGTTDVSGTADTSATLDTSGTPSQSLTRSVGSSVQGRPIVLETFGSGRRHVLIVGGVHGNEYGGPLAARFSAFLRANPSAIPSGTQVDVIAYANPDGRALGRRTNAHNVDINRNFPSRSWSRTRGVGEASPGARPGSEPETQALIGVLAVGRYIRVVSMHSHAGIIDYDGKGGWTLARRISRASRVRVHRLPAYHGSMGSYIPEKYRTPIITWELSSRTLTSRVKAGLLAATK